MVISVVPAKIANPQNRNEVKTYARALIGRNNDFRYMAERISANVSIKRGDAYATLMELEDETIDMLLKGETVELGGIGKLYLSVSSEGVEDEEDFSVRNIKGAKINFRPGSRLREALKSAKYTQVKPPKKVDSKVVGKMVEASNLDGVVEKSQFEEEFGEVEE
ncbi:MAG: HU family DNA-binding protein [Streptococcaceae bacterium]|jgi:predicted histone-like DNA-binding protein|nr:HU family DNA-binding protein [Streptococcaceae bacterium]